jgi:hypothetical protein
MEEQPSQAVESVVSVQAPNIPVSPHVRHIPKGIMILLLLIFAPLAFYFIYKDQKYHRWMVYILYIEGVGVVFYEMMRLLIYIMEVYSPISTSTLKGHPTIEVFVLHVGLMVGGLALIILGKRLSKKMSTGDNYKGLQIGAIILLLVEYLVIFMPIVVIVFSIFLSVL